MKKIKSIRATFALLLCFSSPVFAYVDEGAPPLVGISPYKPVYFVVGRSEGKGQLSLKARPAEAIPLYFGYTQLMIWDIFKSSLPMRDINFNPEVFYRLSFGEPQDLRWLDVGIFEHESNGLNENRSRSWNRSYLRYNDVFAFSGSGAKLQWSIKLWVPYNCETKNCSRYRGITEVTVALENLLGSHIGENDISLRFYGGGLSRLNFLKGGQELMFRLRPGGRAIIPLLVFQLFQGYGENMLDQDRKGLALRGGLGF
jgi:outer membrane phospholipase A